MKSMGQGKKSNVEKNDTQHGYWQYKDGSSYWGIGIMKGHEVPVKITQEEHKETATKAKLAEEMIEEVIDEVLAEEVAKEATPAKG